VLGTVHFRSKAANTANVQNRSAHIHVCRRTSISSCKVVVKIVHSTWKLKWLNSFFYKTVQCRSLCTSTQHFLYTQEGQWFQ